jgi:hypothetical protein
MSETKRYWFAAKPPGMGWGWGMPLTWQGLLVYVAFIVLLIVGSIFIAPHSQLQFMLFVAVLAGGLIAICFWKGEPPGGIR